MGGKDATVYYDDDGYANYVATAVQPGPWVMIMTVSYIAVIAVMIPPLVWLGRKLKKMRKWKRVKKQRRKADNIGLVGSESVEVEAAPGVINTVAYGNPVPSADSSEPGIRAPGPVEVDAYYGDYVAPVAPPASTDPPSLFSAPDRPPIEMGRTRTTSPLPPIPFVHAASLPSRGLQRSKSAAVPHSQRPKDSEDYEAAKKWGKAHRLSGAIGAVPKLRTKRPATPSKKAPLVCLIRSSEEGVEASKIVLPDDRSEISDPMDIPLTRARSNVLKRFLSHGLDQDVLADDDEHTKLFSASFEDEAGERRSVDFRKTTPLGSGLFSSSRRNKKKNPAKDTLRSGVALSELGLQQSLEREAEGAYYAGGTGGGGSTLLPLSMLDGTLEGDDGGSVASSVDSFSGTYDDDGWDELPGSAKAAAIILGYDEDIWDNDGVSSSESFRWDELTVEEQSAAALLGYNETGWDGKEPSTLATETFDGGGLYDEYDWSELPKSAKSAARILGYDRRAWDVGGETSSGQKGWKQLSREEKEAAATMGYNKAFWNYMPKGSERTIRQDMVRGWATFSQVIAFNQESWKLMAIAVPFTMESIYDSFLGALVAGCILQYLGTTVFTAYAMVYACFSITDSFSNGVEEASEALISQALGMGEFFMAGQYVQLSTVVWLMGDVPACSLWLFFIDDIIIGLGLGEEIAEIAKAYVPIVVLARIVGGLSDIAGTLLRCDGRVKSMALIDSVFSALYSAAVCTALSQYSVDLITIGWIEIANSVVYGIFMGLFMKWRGWLDPFAKGMFRNNSLRNGNLLRGVLRLSIPLACGNFLSNGEWHVLTYFAAYMGPAEVAAWSIAGYIWEILEDAPSGISSASLIRVGIHLGKGNPQLAKISAYKSLLYSSVYSTFLTILFLLYSDEVLYWFTEDETLFTMMKSLVVMIAAGNVLMCLGGNAWVIMTAQSRTQLATAVFFVCTWCITLPLSATYVYGFNYNVQALGSAVIIGYASIALALLWIVFTSNWVKISMMVIADTSSASSNMKKSKKTLDTPSTVDKKAGPSKASILTDYITMNDESTGSVRTEGGSVRTEGGSVRTEGTNSKEANFPQTSKFYAMTDDESSLSIKTEGGRSHKGFWRPLD